MIGSASVRIPTIAAAFAAAMVFGGCGQPARPAESQPARSSGPPGYRRAWSDDDVVKPAWIANPTQDGKLLAAWGSTPHDPFGGRNEMRNQAMQQARRELAQMIRVKVQSVMQDYVGESDTAVVSFNQSVARTIALQSLDGSYQRDEWVHPKTGEYFILAVVDPAFASKLPQSIGAAAAQDPNLTPHLRAKLESDKGFAELDRLLDQPVK